MGRRGLSDEEAALDRDVEGGVDVRFRDLLERLRHESRRRPVDDHVESAELGNRVLDEGPCGRRLGEVAVAAPGGEDAPALELEPLDEAGAELPGAAGDERPDCAGVTQRAFSNRFATASHLTTFHHAAR